MFDDNLIDVTKLTDARTALICARFNLRGGKRRLQRGLTVSGMAALYDSVLFGMRYYIAKHKHSAPIADKTDLWDAASLFHVLACARVFDDPLSFNRFSLIVERALWQGPSSFDVNTVITESEKMLTKLEVIPLHKSALPNGP